MPILSSQFRVIKPFKCKKGRRDFYAEAGKVVDVPINAEAVRLMSAGYIEPVEIPFSNPDARIPSMPSRTRGKRVGIWLTTSNYYSGGRIHLYQLAWCMADAGAEVFLVTNAHPKWAKDYPKPKLGRIHIVLEGHRQAPDDLDLLITDSKGDLGMGVLRYQAKHPRAPVATMNFETPNWIKDFAPYKEKTLSHDRSVFEKADVLLANSRESLKYLREWLGTDKPGHVLPPAVNTTAADLREDVPEALSGRPFAVWSARPEKYKGADVAVRSILELDIPFDLMLFGSTKVAGQSTDKHKLVPLGGRSDAAKFTLMRNAHMVLAPSKFEGFGMVPMEALASGTPVVARDLPVYREEYAGIDGGMIYVPRGDDDAFVRKVREVALAPKREVDPAPVRERLGMKAMARKTEGIPYHSMRRKRVSAQLIAYWGFLPESLESIYPHVDEILVAFGRVPKAQVVDDGSLERLRAFPDPDKKIRIEVRNDWKDKKRMREWCSRQSTGNYQLVLDGDEVWVGLDEWIDEAIPFGCPRWMNFWHDDRHWVYDSNKLLGLRWGFKIGAYGSYCPHYRWSWWRPSYFWAHHSKPADRSKNSLHTKATDEDASSYLVTAEKVPDCVIYHFGHCLPREIMEAKHEFYLKRDGADPGRVNRKTAWMNWKGELGDCGDGIIEQVTWNIPDIVKRAYAGMKELGVR
ncbi:hypothetical protein LCGC14_1250680 [marine sediment metagenome]|uniref:Uncharacterized protein n=1 Tax=marine sediment metagenome TaxID=412755 RepID=A0A0F9P738_9ZZZZ